MNKLKKLSLILLIVAIAIVLWYAISLSKNQVQPENNNPAETVNNATSTEQILATSTKDWLTYRNEEYGFEIKYPGKWYIKEFEDKATVFIDKTPFSNIEVQPPPLISISVQNINGYKEIVEYKKIGDIKINNYPAEKKLYFSNMLNQDIYVIYIEKNDNIYIIQSQTDDDTYENLINSFKFIK